MDTAIVFFSRDGSTRLAAKVLADRYGAKLVELLEARPRRGFLVSGFRAKTGRHAELAGDPWLEISDTNVLILAAPIWAGSPNPAMNGFLDHAVLTGKRVYLLTVQADPKLARSEEVLAHYSRRVREAGGAVVSTRSIRGERPWKCASEDEVRTRLEGWETAAQ